MKKRTDRQKAIEGLPFGKDKILHKAIDENEKADFGPEEDLQKSCEAYLKLMKINYIHIPNSLFKVAPQFRKMFSGLPDLIIFKKGMKFDRVLFVELKRDIGQLHQSQKNFARYFNVYVKRSIDDFIKLVENFMEAQAIENRQYPQAHLRP